MEIFNIGFGEVLFILLIALVLLGPQEMTKAARGLGKFLRQLLRSPLWNEAVNTSRQLRDLPNRIIREANLEETLKELRQTADETQDEIQGELQQIGAETNAFSEEVRKIGKEPSAGITQEEDPADQP